MTETKADFDAIARILADFVKERSWGGQRLMRKLKYGA